jgi:hypothetical protein
MLSTQPSNANYIGVIINVDEKCIILSDVETYTYN